MAIMEVEGEQESNAQITKNWCENKITKQEIQENEPRHCIVRKGKKQKTVVLCVINSSWKHIMLIMFSIENLAKT